MIITILIMIIIIMIIIIIINRSDLVIINKKKKKNVLNSESYHPSGPQSENQGKQKKWQVLWPCQRTIRNCGP